MQDDHVTKELPSEVGSVEISRCNGERMNINADK